MKYLDTYKMITNWTETLSYYDVNKKIRWSRSVVPNIFQDATCVFLSECSGPSVYGEIKYQFVSYYPFHIIYHHTLYIHIGIREGYAFLRYKSIID